MNGGRRNVISGMFFGKVDWVDNKEQVVGMYLRPHDVDSPNLTRCVVRGPVVAAAIANKSIHKGMALTAHGEISAKAFIRRDSGEPQAELICTAAKLFSETSLEPRYKGAIYINIKGVIMNFSNEYNRLKTFFNAGEEDRTEQFTASLSLNPWIQNMSPVARERFLSGVRVGREYTSSSLAEVSCYRDRGGVLRPTILLLPTDFKLQS